MMHDEDIPFIELVLYVGGATARHINSSALFNPLEKQYCGIDVSVDGRTSFLISAPIKDLSLREQPSGIDTSIPLAREPISRKQ